MKGKFSKVRDMSLYLEIEKANRDLFSARNDKKEVFTNSIFLTLYIASQSSLIFSPASPVTNNIS